MQTQAVLKKKKKQNKNKKQNKTKKERKRAYCNFVGRYTSLRFKYMLFAGWQVRMVKNTRAFNAAFSQKIPSASVVQFTI